MASNGEKVPNPRNQDYSAINCPAVSRFQHKLLLLLSLRGLVAFATAWIFAWGTIALILRVLTSVPRSHMLIAFSGLVPVTLIGVLLELRRMPPRHQLIAMLDGMTSSGGLLMASENADVAAWQDRFAGLAVPDVTWQSRKGLGILLISAAFGSAVILVPDKYTHINSAMPLEVGRIVSQIEAKIEVLETEKVIDSAKATELQRELERVKAEAAGYDPAKTWETLDHLNNLTSEEARKAAEDALAKSTELAAAERAAEALADLSAGNKIDPQASSALMRELGAMMQAAGLSEFSDKFDAKALGLDPAAAEQLLAAALTGNMSPDQLRQLSELLKNMRAGSLSTVANLKDLKLVDPKDPQSCKGGGTNACDSAALVAFLSENGGNCSLADALDNSAGAPGSGGVNRGRGDAPLTWTDPSNDANVGFKEKTLPMSKLPDLKKSPLVGVSVAAPQATDSEEPAASGGLASSTKGPGSANMTVMLPRHRSAVKQYFERKENR